MKYDRTEKFEVGYRSPNYEYRRYARFKDRDTAYEYAREKVRDGRTHVKLKMLVYEKSEYDLDFK